MPAGIYGERFFGRQEEPAWHQLGTVALEDLSAVEAYERMGAYRVTVEPTYTTIERKRITLPGRVIMRHPTDDDDRFLPFGDVGPEYVLITPEQACSIYDEVVGKPIETMGALDEGRTFFLTTKLPALDVKGDEVEMYEAAIVPMDGLHVAKLLEVGIRIVCQNTLQAALGSAVTEYRIVHDATALERFGEWMRTSYEEAAARVALLKDAFTALAEHNVKRGELKHVIEIAYPTPKPPRRDAPAAVIEKRMKVYEFRVDRIARYRETATSLFKGDGVGQDHPAAKGTAWGLYNAIAENEQYVRAGSTRDEGEEYKIAEALLVGDRASTITRAFEASMALVTS